MWGNVKLTIISYFKLRITQENVNIQAKLNWNLFCYNLSAYFFISYITFLFQQLSLFTHDSCLLGLLSFLVLDLY